MRPRPVRSTVVLTAVALLALAGCSSGPTGSGGLGALPTGVPVTDLTKLCDLLGPGDFAGAGFPGGGAATVNSDGPGSAYCVYVGQSAGTGGLELDVFVGEDAQETYDTILAEGAEVGPIAVPGVDAVVGGDGLEGRTDRPASIVVRKGNLVFTIAAPGGPGVAMRLAALAGVVLARAAGLVG